MVQYLTLLLLMVFKLGASAPNIAKEDCLIENDPTMLAFSYGCYFNYNGDCKNQNQGSKLDTLRPYHRFNRANINPECTPAYIWEKNGIRGLFQSPEAFEPKSVITVAGDWNRAVFIGNTSAGEDGECAFDTMRICQENASTIHESRGCFSATDDIETYAKKEFKVDDVTVHYPDRKMLNLEMSASQSLNLTIVRTNYLPGCEHRQVTCHKYAERGCLTSLCYTVKDTKVFQVWVRPSIESHPQPVRMIAVCYFDTRQWDKEHTSFKVLQKKPGDPVCHFILHQDSVICADYEYPSKLRKTK